MLGKNNVGNRVTNEYTELIIRCQQNSCQVFAYKCKEINKSYIKRLVINFLNFIKTE